MGVMNAIVDALPADAVETVSLLLSLTTPTELNSMTRLRAKTGGQSGPLGSVGCAHSVSPPPRYFNHVCPVLTPSSIQGASYQAAQYLGKTMMAEVWQSKAGFRGSF